MRRTISFLIAFLLICFAAVSGTPGAGALSAGDICSRWSEAYINDAEGLYRILPDRLSTGDYTKQITREEFCELAYETIAYIAGSIRFNEALLEESENESDGSFDFSGGPRKLYPDMSSETPPFTDTDNLKIYALFKLGIVKGTGGGRFMPKEPLTRQEAAMILLRIADYFSFRHFESGLVFTDADSISETLTGSVDAVCGMGIMNGMGDGTFSPGAYLTREQAAAAMVRVIGCHSPYGRELIEEGRYFVFNAFRLWVENEEGGVLFELPMYMETYDYRTGYGYSSMRFFKRGEKLIAACAGISGDPESLSGGKNGTTFFDVDSGEELLFISESSGCFYSLTKDRDALIMRDTRYDGATVDSSYSVYAVYGFEGSELLAPGSGWEDLVRRGYADAEPSA